mgnify:CR=1 FL=1
MAPRLRAQNRDDCWQRQTVDVVAEPHARNVVKRQIDVFLCQVAHGRAQTADEPVENDFEHRQTRRAARALNGLLEIGAQAVAGRHSGTMLEQGRHFGR